MAGQKNMHHRRKERQDHAKQLHEERAQRTTAQQIKLLDQRLGRGVGAQKERRRLAALMEGPVPQKGEKKPRTRSDRRKAKAKRNRDREAQNNVES